MGGEKQSEDDDGDGGLAQPYALSEPDTACSTSTTFRAWSTTRPDVRSERFGTCSIEVSRTTDRSATRKRRRMSISSCFAIALSARNFLCRAIASRHPYLCRFAPSQFERSRRLRSIFGMPRSAKDPRPMGK
eukprot:1946089-Rhodomonas_salina.1